MTPTIFPYLSYRDTVAALQFLEEAFGFTTNVRWEAPFERTESLRAATLRFRVLLESAGVNELEVVR